MPNIQQIAELLLSVSGVDAVASLNESLERTTDSLTALKQSFERGDVPMDEFIKTGSKLANQERALKDQIDAVTAAMNKQAAAADDVSEATAASVGKVGKVGGESAFKIMQLGQTLDDLQYVGEMGLRPIINNVMQLDARLGIALIAIQGLVSVVGDKLVKSFADFIGTGEKAVVTVDSLGKKIEELEKKPHKIAADYSDLDRAREVLAKLKAEQEAFDAGKGDKQTKALGAAATDVTESYLGGSEALRGVVLAMEKEGGFKHGSGADQALLAKLKYQLEHPEIDARTGLAKYDPAMVKRGIDEVEARMTQAASEYAKQEVGQFNAGDTAAIQRMKNRAVQRPGAFAGVGADGVTGAEALRDMADTPAEMRRRTKEKEMKLAQIRNWANEEDETGKAAAAAEKERKAAVEKSIKETEAEDTALDRFADVAAPAAAAKAKAEADRIRDRQREAMRGIAEQEAKRNADPVKTSQARLADEAERALRSQGASPQFAEQAAPRLAELLGQGVNLQTATLAAWIETQNRLSQIGAQMQRNEHWTRTIQSMQRRTRTMQPTTQPVPFATP